MPARPVPWRLVTLAILIVVVSTQPVFLLGAAFLSVGPEFGFGPTGLGVLTAGFFLSASLASAPLGRVVQRIGWKRSVRFNASVSGAILIVIAVAARNIVVFALLIVMAGLVYGLSNPAANLALAEHVDPRRRALIFGLKHAGIPASTLIAGLAIPAVIVHLGWRAAYAIAALISLVVWALSLAADEPVVASDAVDPERRVEPMSTGMLIGLALGASFATWGAIALSTYLVAAAVDRGLTEVQAGWLLFAGSAASISARVTAGHITDRVRGRGFGAITALTGTGVVVFSLLGAASGAYFVALVLAAFATGWGWPGLMTYTVVNANAGTAASSSGITQAGIFFGAGAGPIVLGVVVEHWGFNPVWIVVACTLAAAATVVAVVGHRATTRG